MFSSEKEFGKFLMGKLRSEGCSCTRLETAVTSTGVPDLLVQSRADDYFIELKNCKEYSICSMHWKIPWREGQQGFAVDYMSRHTRRVFTYETKGMMIMLSKCAWTAVAMQDGVLLIRMTELHDRNNVVPGSSDVFLFTFDAFRKLNLNIFLKEQTYRLKGADILGPVLSARVVASCMCMVNQIAPELIEWDFNKLGAANSFNDLRHNILVNIKDARDTYLGGKHVPEN